MKLFKILLSLVILTPLIAACTTTYDPLMPRVTTSPRFSPQVYDRIAIYVENNNDNRRSYNRGASGALREVEDEFMRAVIENGYTLAARSDLDQILREQELQQSSYTETAIAQRARAINVSAVIIVSINGQTTTRFTPALYQRGVNYYRSEASISARMISAELAQVVWLSSYQGSQTINNMDEQNNVLPLIARIVARGLPSKSM